MKQGVLIINTGSPDRPDAGAVRSYLREFLSDGRVMDVPFLLRMMILHLFILPFRPARSARSYRKIWTNQGSPLLQISWELRRLLSDELQKRTGSPVAIKLAMRYGNPSIEKALDEFQSEGIRNIILLPLFPQEASATTSSILSRVYELAAKKLDPPSFQVVEPFFQSGGFVEALAATYMRSLAKAKTEEGFEPDHILFTFHGLPERHLHKSLPDAACLQEGCCDVVTERNYHCYRAQCYETARRVTDLAGIPSQKTSVSFQSRLGRIPWIRPYTDEHLQDLARTGVKKLAVAAPSFVTDCLETLEELAISSRDIFRKVGGEDLVYLSAPNQEKEWVEFLASTVLKKMH